MTQFTRSSNPELYDILLNIKSSSDTIEKINTNVYLITLPQKLSLSSFLIDLKLDNDNYDYGIAYIDILQEIDTSHNRNFNTYSFYFDKPVDNIIKKIVDVSGTIFIDFIENPAYNIKRTQNFDRFISEDSVLSPVFPDQTEILKSNSYLPLFPLDISKLTLTNIKIIPQNDIYEVRHDESKTFLSPSDRYDIFSESINISAFNNSLLDNFFVDPMGMFGNEIKNVQPFIFVTPDQNAATDPSEDPFLSIPNEIQAIGSIEGIQGLTIATKSYQGNTNPLRYCTLRNKHIGSDGTLTGQYIKISFDFYSLESSSTSISFPESNEDINNPASSLYLDAGTLLSNCFMETTASDSQNRPTQMKIYIKDKECGSNVSAVRLDLSETITYDSVVEFNPNFIQTLDKTESTPNFASKKISKESSLYLISSNFLDNFDPQFGISSSNISNLYTVDYEYVSTCDTVLQINGGYSQGVNIPTTQSLNDGLYIVFIVRIVWE